jgi:hypothetical protein
MGHLKQCDRQQKTQHWGVQGQPRLPSETLSQKGKQQKSTKV